MALSIKITRTFSKLQNCSSSLIMFLLIFIYTEDNEGDDDDDYYNDYYDNVTISNKIAFYLNSQQPKSDSK